jgi:uncharacterized protein with PQ loop repeat
MFTILSTTSLPPHCTPNGPVLEWLSSTFHTCLPSNLGLISTLLGVLSIASWLFAQVPQIVKNFQLHSTSGLSILFLAEWLLGDLSNLLGSIFTNQASWQIVLACYYCFVDCVLVGQWMWYEHLRHGRIVRRMRWWKRDNNGDDVDGARDKRRHRHNTGVRKAIKQRILVNGVPVREDIGKGKSKPIATLNRSGESSNSSSLGGNGFFRIPRFSYSSSGSTLNTPQSPSHPRMILRPAAHQSPAPSPKTILFISLVLAIAAQASPVHSPSRKGFLISSTRHSSLSGTEWAGRILSWLSTILYLGSRLPQLIHNATRRSTSGLSASLFLAAFFGNLFYSSSLLTNPNLWHDFDPYGGGGWADPEGSKRALWALRAAPFWLGAAGVLVMDAAVGAQFVMYREKEKSADVSEVLVVEDVGMRGRSRWRRVSGWMRGWMPSAGERMKGENGTETGTETETETETETDSLLSSRADGDSGSVRSYGGLSPSR